MTREELMEKRAAIAAKRGTVAQLKEEVGDRKRAWEEQNAELLQLLLVEQQALEWLESDAKQSILDCYGETGDKAPCTGFGVRINQQVVVEDMAAAIEYALAHVPKAIALDMKMFEKYVKAVCDTVEMPFVTVLDKPTATISKDLEGIR